MGFNSFPKSVNAEGSEGSKNNLIRLRKEYSLGGDATVLGQLGGIIAQFENEWFEQNKERVGGYETLTPAQMTERDKYVSSINQMHIRDIINERIKFCEDDIGNLNESEVEREISKNYKKALEKIRMKLSSA